MTKSRTLVIAEAGVNHNGSVDLALRLIDAAADAGADVVKFQTFRAEHLVTAAARKATYQARNTGSDGSQIEMLRQLELDADAHERLARHCSARGVRFMSTAFDEPSLDLLASMDVPAIKIPSGDVTFAPMLLRAARLGRPLIVSTGMCTLGDVEAALGVIAFALTQPGLPSSSADCEAAFASSRGQAALRERVTLLHCTTQYPAPYESVNLRAMRTLADAFGLPVGYSDHTEGTEVTIAAVALGACVIEKHFTLDRTLPGPDHAASLEPGELKALVASVRAVELSLGSAVKAPSEAEWGNRAVARRSIVAARPLSRGQALSMEDLAFKRPGTGLVPLQVWALMGRPATRDYAADDPIEP